MAWQQPALERFRTIWVIDFEFGQNNDRLPDVRCMTARELRSGERAAFWEDALLEMPEAPFGLGEGALVVVFYGLAEISCFARLGWPYPANLVDLHAECRCRWNGIPLEGSGLVDFAKHIGVTAPGEEHKDYMRRLALRGGSYSEEEKQDLLAYCEEDVATTAGVFRRLTGMDWFGAPERVDQALLRGKYISALADIERLGVPIDREMLTACRDSWDTIRETLITELDGSSRVYDRATFKEARFSAYLARERIPWPRSAHGRLKLDAETFKERTLLYPAIEPLKELRKTLSRAREIKLTVGADGRNRYMQSPFGTVTGRNNPSTTEAVFGLPRWLRGLVRPEPGTGLAYIDWTQQEFGIAAALSRDPEMLAAYESGDPYLSFAKRAGAAPSDATKQSHPDVRRLYKTCVLAVQYQMSAQGLSRRLEVPLHEARELLDQHRRLYRRYWEWIERVSDHAFLNTEMSACFGWRLNVSAETKPRTVANFQMQSNGAEMLRLAVIFGREEGIKICATIHDAVLIEAPLDELEAQTAAMQSCMAEASSLVLDGFELGSDAEYTRYPDAFGKRQDPMWELVNGVIGRRT
ncbi:MAG: DNA polymerase [Alphaproteobacteria bacterium]|nr:DNA polymerase [Alphaproteobacteria bacterium]